ncbi:MAG: type I-C CRISPR-associated protein Cas8c/Csd1 [Oscillospiraceae bacterium]|nr:type I-C CRISPR-associated protein Cas8c/Csd1 [Oscillospiraceae bacterium]
MILQALTDLYETLVEKGKLEAPGWTMGKVSWALELDDDGKVVDVHPLRIAGGKGNKMVPAQRRLPAPVKRTVGIAANFLWDNSSYILGSDSKGKPERALRCFDNASALHQTILAEVDSPAARALVNYYQSWRPDDLESAPALAERREELLSGENITFFYRGRPVAEDPEIQRAWARAYSAESGTEEGTSTRCLITGEETVPEKIHPAIKNVRGAQSSGAALVSFNAPAFCSFGHEQNANAPVSRYAAFAYTAALNHLLADREHVKIVGDASVVYWAKDAGEQYTDLWSELMDGGDQISGETLDELIAAIATGKEARFRELPIHPANEFFVLGISPNAARLSVRFFYHSSFGDLVAHLQQHYEDIRIVSDGRNKWRMMPLWALLRETVNAKSSDKTPLPQLAGDVMKSMLSGGRYPETLLYQTLLRIRAEHDITCGRAGIVKAWLIRNTKEHPLRDAIKEVSIVSLNTESSFTPYVLGRLFAVLEGLQQDANPGINATIKDRFFNSACSTPAAVFPLLMKLSNSHLRKLEAGRQIFWSKQTGDLLGKLGESFPAHLSLQEQGAFILGYYHQTQKRYEKKTDTVKEEK